MSLLLIVGKLWKYKLFTLPIFALVVAGSIYVYVVKAPTYEAPATYILINPPAPPTDAQIAAKPALGRIDSDNPYLRFSDLTVVVQVLATKLSSQEIRRTLVEQGADPNYAAAPSPEFGFNSPIIQITGTGPTPATAVHTANLVGEAMSQELDQMQAIRGVDKMYWINAEVVVGAHDATLKASGKLRALVAVFALGMILMFIAVSVLDAIATLRAEWAKRRREEDSPGLTEDEDSTGSREEDLPGNLEEDLPGNPEEDPTGNPDIPAAPGSASSRPQTRSAVPIWDPPGSPQPTQSLLARLGFGKEADRSVEQDPTPDQDPTRKPDYDPTGDTDENPAGRVSVEHLPAQHHEQLSPSDTDIEAPEWPLLIQR
jgi:hypothetical protein